MVTCHSEFSFILQRFAFSTRRKHLDQSCAAQRMRVNGHGQGIRPDHGPVHEIGASTRCHGDRNYGDGSQGYRHGSQSSRDLAGFRRIHLEGSPDGCFGAGTLWLPNSKQGASGEVGSPSRELPAREAAR